MSFERIKTVAIILASLVILLLLAISEPKKELWNDLLIRKALHLVKEGNFKEAKSVYRRILTKDPEQARALRGMGSLHALDGEYEQAIQFYKSAALLGDMPSLRMLVGMYIKTDQIEEIHSYVPELLLHKQEDQEFLNALLAYAINSHDHTLFREVMADVSPDYIEAREDTAQLVSKAHSLLLNATNSNE